MRLTRMTEDDVALAVSAWNETLVHNRITEQKFRRILLQDSNYEPEAVRLARSDDDSIVGLAACVVRRKVEGKDGGGREEEFGRGYLKAFYVAEHADRLLAARALLEAAESYCVAAGKRELYVTQYTGPFFFPGIDVRYQRLLEILVAHGYRDTRTIEDVAVDLRGASINTRLEQARERAGAGVELLTWRPDLLPEMRRFVEEGNERQWFPVGWESRWTRERERSFVLRKSREIIGWADYHAGHPRAGFGPTLVLPRERGRGYGALLLLECMRRARDEGSQTMSAGWANTGFYVACGWHVSRRFAVLVKEL